LNRPGPALLGSVVLHAAAIGAVMLAMLGHDRPARDFVQAVPVSIVSDTVVIEAAAADNPSDELVAEDAAAAPVAAPPEPTPAEPTPAPPRPTPTPSRSAPTPTPPRTQPTPPRPRPQPPRPAPPREEGLDLSALAADRPSTGTGRRPATGQQGAGSAPRAVGRASLQALAAQITPHWNVNCDLPGADDLTIGVRVTLDERGRVVGSPSLTRSRSDPAWRAASDSMLRAIRAAAPFDMPPDYEQQEIPFSFRTANMCGNR
jgi:outer membrane biosynthesis protein TonB